MVGKVGNIRTEKSGENSLSVIANVANEETEINFWKEGNDIRFESYCSCEVGSDCVHAVALMAKLAKSKFPARVERAALDRGIAELISKPSEVIEIEDALLPELIVEPRFHLHVRREVVDRQMQILLQSLGQAQTSHWICAEAVIHYGKHRRLFSNHDSLPVLGEHGEPVRLVRNKMAETAALMRLRDMGFSSLQTNAAWKFLLHTKWRDAPDVQAMDRWFPDPSIIPIDDFWYRFRGEWMEKLENDGWKITVDDQVGHRVHMAEPAAWKTKLDQREVGWFSLSVGFDVAGERYDLLPILANLLENHFLEETLDRPAQGFVYSPLPNGDALKLPIGRVRIILQHLAAVLDPKFPERTRLHLLDAAALAAIEPLGIEAPSALREQATKLRDFSKIAATEPPEGLQATLRDYQKMGYQWLQFLARHGLHGILADDMGLGKTLQIITHLLEEKQSGASSGMPSLVVCPTSVVPNWQAEVKKFAPSLRVLMLNGPERKSYFRSIPYADLVITSFALLQRDIDVLEKHSFHAAVLDEAQHIKNPRAMVSQAACRLQAKHRLCLSGTPIENHLGELFSLMHFLVPGFLGSESSFQEMYRTPIEKNGDDARRLALKNRLAPLILRRTKDQVAKELPPKTELVHLIELESSQKDLYETVRATMDKRVREAIAARGLSQFQMVFLDALLKLRQICCDPRLLPEEMRQETKASAKLDYLMELILVLLEEGRRILLFSQFTSMLDKIEACLLENKITYLKLTGASKDRGQLVEQFQSGKVSLFLISLKAGGTGLNLTKADTVIHYDPWWNPAVEAQATDRAYRIGQENPVFVHKLLCQDTVEERIHRMQQKKGKLAAGFLDGADAAQALDASMVRMLLDP